MSIVSKCPMVKDDRGQAMVMIFCVFAFEERERERERKEERNWANTTASANSRVEMSWLINS